MGSREINEFQNEHARSIFEQMALSDTVLHGHAKRMFLKSQNLTVLATSLLNFGFLISCTHNMLFTAQ